MVREHLVCALVLQVWKGLGDPMQDIDEMASLILELFNSDISTISTDIISAFANMAIIQFFDRQGEGQGPLGKVIDCLQKAKICLPDSDVLSPLLTFTLLACSQFQTAYSDDDYEEGTAILDNILTSHLPGDGPNLLQDALLVAAACALTQLQVSGRPEHFKEAIYQSQNCLPWIPLGDPCCPYLIYQLTTLEYVRFHYFSVGGGSRGESL